ncbi:SMP-30/gluconolactonase/LRE family protein [Sphingobium sp. Z007]|uniref:SMP-30/gluconolactonase/LRE family protein n=1 Tax=Sphingobium sp. Z007 TaxID=627495 RepID=UPI000B4A2DAC|nr:SMP-30/gluconolactonase/LRE family protein [Sphingobium sp. Z007]
MQEWRLIDRGVADTLGEGTLWSARDNAVYWVDILAPALNRLSLASGAVDRFAMPEPLGWVAERQAGGFIGGLQSGFAEISLDPLVITAFADPEPHFPGNRMNDGKADAQGHIWCGTMDMAEEHDRGVLYRLAPDRSWRVIDSDYRVPNGPTFSPCGTWLYHSDTAKQQMYRFRRTEEGATDREPFIRFSEEDGYPDGMTVDAEGHIWVAHWGGSRISRFTPDGRLDRAIALPARQVTNITFAGGNLDRMFVSSASVGMDDPTEYDGGFFEVESGVRGLPTHLYAG